MSARIQDDRAMRTLRSKAWAIDAQLYLSPGLPAMMNYDVFP